MKKFWNLFKLNKTNLKKLSTKKSSVLVGRFRDLLQPHQTDPKKLNAGASIIQELSISNDEVAVLAERLEFFLPKFKTFAISERLIYILVWSLIVSMMQYNNDYNLDDFFWIFSFELVLITLIVLPAFSLLDILRPHLKRLSLGYACVQIWVFMMLVAGVAILVVINSFNTLHLLSPNMNNVFLIGLIHLTAISMGSILILLYYLTRYNELALLAESFELKLAAQNELIKSRISPHFFFNTLNVLNSLIESDPKKAGVILNKISTLFRASFDDASEIGLDEEINLCKVFLAIDEARFHDKIRVEWNLPDEDTMYDMVITGLTLQSVLEKVLHHVAEITTETIYTRITVKWENHWVTISIEVDLPKRTLLVKEDLNYQMNFDIQERRLKLYFGNDSTISTHINENDIIATLSYPLHENPEVEVIVSNNVSTMSSNHSNLHLSD